MMNKRLFHLLVVFLGVLICTPINAQSRRSTPEFMEAAGFTSGADGEWKNSNGATVKVDGDKVIAFTAPQTHSWKMIFGDGSQFGKTLNIKSGDKITFADSTITFPGGVQFKLLSEEKPVGLSRGVVKSAIFNPAREQLNATDLKIVGAVSYSMGWLNTTGKPEEDNYLDEQGNIVSLVLAAEDAEKARQRKLTAQAESRLQKNRTEKYEEYCRKYGKDKIDRAIAGDIVPGVPWEFTKTIINHETIYRIENVPDRFSLNTRYILYPIVYEPNRWNTIYHVYVSPETGLVVAWYKGSKFYRK